MLLALNLARVGSQDIVLSNRGNAKNVPLTLEKEQQKMRRDQNWQVILRIGTEQKEQQVDLAWLLAGVSGPEAVGCGFPVSTATA